MGFTGSVITADPDTVVAYGFLPDRIENRVKAVDNFGGKYILADFNLNGVSPVISHGNSRIQRTVNAFLVDLFLYHSVIHSSKQWHGKYGDLPVWKTA